MIIDGWVNIVHGVQDTPSTRQVTEMFGLKPGGLATTSEHVLAAMDAAGVDRGVIPVALGNHLSHRMGMAPAPFEQAMKAVGAANGRLIPTLMVTSLDDVMQSCRAIRSAVDKHPEVRGVLVAAFALEAYLTDPRLYPIYATCVDLDLPLVANAGIAGPPMKSKFQHPMLLEDIMVDFPELRVAIGHGGHPWERLVIRLMAKFRNLHLLTSAWKPKYLDPELIDFMNSSRGKGRVMFGSDYPVIDPKVGLAQARALPLTDAALEGYLGENMRAFLKL